MLLLGVGEVSGRVGYCGRGLCGHVLADEGDGLVLRCALDALLLLLLLLRLGEH